MLVNLAMIVPGRNEKEPEVVRIEPESYELSPSQLEELKKIVEKLPPPIKEISINDYSPGIRDDESGNREY